MSETTMMPIEIGSSTLTQLLRRHKLWRSYVGPDAIADLQKVCAAPVPLRTGQLHGKPPSDCKHMGRLRTHGFVELNRAEQRFEATEAGRRWLKDVLTLLQEWKGDQMS
jgi:hypothetical protein